MNLSYYVPTRLFFGKGELNRLATERLPGKKALIVLSAGGSMSRGGYLDRVKALLEQNQTEYILFQEILPNPMKKHVMEGARICKEQGCDFVLGLGGGSAIDSAKSIAVMAANPGDYWDYISGGTGKGQPLPNTPLPIVAIPSTAGTGTESDPWTVITNENGEKIGFGGDGTYPTLSIVDPDLMRTVPAKLTAYQGFDALFHCAEGYIANVATPMSDIFALKAIGLLHKYLARAVKNGDDEEAREQVALASTMAGFVESLSSCTSEHSIEHAMSGRHPELPHGAGLIMISQEYFKLFTGYVPGRFFSLAAAMGDGDARHAESFVRELSMLQRACGVDDLRMSEYGITKEELRGLAQHAMDTMPGLFEVDRHKLSLNEVQMILEKSYR